MDRSFWTTQGFITELGDDAAVRTAVDALPSDIPSLREAVSQLCLHYRGCASQVQPARFPEIHTVRAADLFKRILARGGSKGLDSERSADERTVGCCRDSSLLLVSILRHKGIPARLRIGHAAYFMEGFMLDHVVAEVWDDKESRWRLVDADVPGDWQRTVQGKTVDWNDVRPGVEFQTAPEAWVAARAGKVDPQMYIIAPQVELRGMPYILHNVVHDLAAMDKQELLLWDAWGLLLGMSEKDQEISESRLHLIDDVAKMLLDRGVAAEKLQAYMATENFRVTDKVLRYDPNAPGQPPKMVDLYSVST